MFLEVKEERKKKERLTIFPRLIIKYGVYYTCLSHINLGIVYEFLYNGV